MQTCNRVGDPDIRGPSQSLNSIVARPSLARNVGSAATIAAHRNRPNYFLTAFTGSFTASKVANSTL